MKTKLPILMLITICLTFFTGAAQSREKNQADKSREFIHGVYIVGGWLKDEQIKQTRFEEFNFIYLQGGPYWKAKDFEMSKNDVMNKLVRNHLYSSKLAPILKLIAKAHKKKVKVLVSLNGRKRFNPIANDSKKRELFAHVMAEFVKKYNYDGIEIDWEHTYERIPFILLMIELRKALNSLEDGSGTPKRKYYLTTALHPFRKFTKGQAKKLSDAVDWINIMTYGMGCGTWGRTPKHNTPLSGPETKVSIKNALRKWSVFPPDKLCIGLANYGFLYKGISPGQKCEGPLRKKARSFTYKEFPALLKKGWKESYDEEAEAPYYFSPNKADFLTIDNERSLDRKMEWIFKKGFRGVFWWEFQHDYFPPAGKGKYARHPLIDHVEKTIEKFEKESK